MKCGYTTTHGYAGPYVCEKERPCADHGTIDLEEKGSLRRVWFQRGAADFKARALEKMKEVLSKDAFKAVRDVLEGL